MEDMPFFYMDARIYICTCAYILLTSLELSTFTRRCRRGFADRILHGRPKRHSVSHDLLWLLYISFSLPPFTAYQDQDLRATCERWSDSA